MREKIIYKIIAFLLRLNRALMQLSFWSEQGRRRVLEVIALIPESTSDDMLEEEITLGGRHALKIQSRQDEPKRILLFFHGGGYHFLSARTHRNLVYEVCKAGGLQGFALDYRLAPEDAFPRGLEDSVAAYEDLLSQGYAPEDIVLGGDSAGGGMTLALLLKLKELGISLPSAAFCFSPWTDLTLSGDSHKNNQRKDPMLGMKTLRKWSKSYGGAELENPLVSPLYGDYTGLPPILVHVGENEILLDDTIRLGKVAEAKGWDIEVKEWPGMLHAFQAFAGILKDSRRSIGEVAEFLEKVKVKPKKAEQKV